HFLSSSSASLKEEKNQTKNETLTSQAKTNFRGTSSLIFIFFDLKTSQTQNNGKEQKIPYSFLHHYHSNQNALEFHDLNRTTKALFPFSSPFEEMGGGGGGEGASYTVDDALTKMGFGTFQALVLAYAGMGQAAEAMEMMLLSFVGPAVQAEWGLSSRQESMITSVVFAGMLVGAYTWGIVSDNYGRRQVLSI
ncbi:hypothetical protein MKW98_021912, partial [Papaver atlanticum]